MNKSAGMVHGQRKCEEDTLRNVRLSLDSMVEWVENCVPSPLTFSTELFLRLKSRIYIRN